MKLEISQLKLKQAPQNEKQQFVVYVFNTFDPNFYSDEEAFTNQATIYQFIEDCELTLNEMIKAIQMVLNGELVNEKSEQIEIRHKISLISLYEIKRAYIRYKQADFQHTKGLKMIHEASKPKAKQMTDEEKVLTFLTGILNDFEEFKTSNRLAIFSSRHYYPLYHLGLLPKHDEQFRNHVKERAIEQLKKDLLQEENRKEKAFLKQIIESQMTDESRFKVKAHEIIVSDFFTKIIRENKSISDVLREKTQGKSYAEIVELIKY